MSFHRVDGVVFDVAGFTNLTQDHLDLHGTMDEYFQTKARLFTPQRARRRRRDRGRRVGPEAGRRRRDPGDDPGHPPAATAGGSGGRGLDGRRPGAPGLGTEFILRHRDGTELRVHTGLPGSFNVANAALATVDGARRRRTSRPRCRPPSTPRTPSPSPSPAACSSSPRHPAAVVDFAHNPDALARALEAVRSPEPGSRVIIVFGATGQRDQGKRPAMGAIAARLADTVIVSDDDPHDEDAAAIRADVLAGALAAKDDEGLDCTVLEVFPRDAAIRKAVELAGAGGHHPRCRARATRSGRRSRESTSPWTTGWSFGTP